MIELQSTSLCLKVNILYKGLGTLVLPWDEKGQELIIKANWLRSLWFSDFRLIVLSVALTERENSEKQTDFRS